MSSTFALVSDAVAAADEAGLRYVTDARPGIRRRKGRGRRRFEYVSPAGRVIRDQNEIARIDRLAIPPAWTDVWICPNARGHIQATGRDARGRKQYRYHPEWRAWRDETKFDRMLAFVDALPTIRMRTNADLAKPGLSREKVLATVVQLLEKSLIRVGNEEYARQNRSYGLTTLRNDHAKVRGGKVTFEFKGKSGVRHSIDVEDPRLARVVVACQDLPGQELFEYVDDDGQTRDVGSADVNAYLREISGADFTTKDFRTWAATVLAATALRELCRNPSGARTKKNVVRAVEAVATVLGNTATVCRKSYIHPAILESYMDGSMRTSKRARSAKRARGGGLRPDEKAALALLRRQLARAEKRKVA